MRPIERVVQRGIVAFRAAALVGVVVNVVLVATGLIRPGVAIAAVLTAVAFTVWAAYAYAVRPQDLVQPWAVIVEVGIASFVNAADGWALVRERTWQPAIVGSIWPLAAPMAAGVARGPLWGGVAGLVVGLARLFGLLAPDIQLSGLDFYAIRRAGAMSLHGAPTMSFVFLHIVIGVGAGVIARQLRDSEKDVSSARARDELARSLHDGVLQTLLLLGHRVGDPALARLARDSARELRSFIRGEPDGAHSLGDALGKLTSDFARSADIDPQVVIAPDLPSLTPTAEDALTLATREVLANVVKHANAQRVNIYAGPDDDGVLVTVKDDGGGFDPGRLRSDGGLTRSVRARLESLGGRVAISSSPGAGTEVSMWIG